ncbi:MAG: NAD(P)-dependent oxidoreductase [Solirubrobacteraceae bacterium]
MSFTIAWVDGQPPEEVEFGQQMLPDGFDLIADPEGAAAAPDRWAELVSGADALVTRAVPVAEAQLRAAPRAQLVQKYGAREDGIDLDAAADAGVAVATMPLRGCIAVAECAMTLMLALSKQLIRAHEATVTGAYRDLGLQPELTSQRKHGFQWMELEGLFEVAGKSLGIVGFGEIGTEIAQRAQAFAMTVSYTKRMRLSERIEKRLGVTYKPLDQLLADSNVVVVAAPHTPETERIIAAGQLALMRADAVLVNISRGGLVDEAALVEALTERRIAGAGLDVYVEEPVPFDHPLLTLDSVILTPHLGGGTGGAREKQLRDVLDNVVLAGRGSEPRYLIGGARTHA